MALLVPKGDPLAKEFQGRVMVFEGPEDDVLARYANAVNGTHPDFIVRVTGDCPFIPPYIISTHVKKSIIGRLHQALGGHG